MGLNGTMETILAYLEVSEKPMGTIELAAEMDCSYSHVNQHLLMMQHKGIVKKIKRGMKTVWILKSNT